MKPSKFYSQMAPHTLKHNHFNTIPATIMIVGVWKRVGRGRLTSKRWEPGSGLVGGGFLKLVGGWPPKQVRDGMMASQYRWEVRG